MKIGFVIKNLSFYYHLVKPIIDNEDFKDENICLFHISSLYDETIEEDVEERIELVDLCNENNIFYTIRNSDLDFMVFFNPGQIFNVFLTAICKELNIVTIYFQHGLSLNYKLFDYKILNRGKTNNDVMQSLKTYWYFYRAIFINIFYVRNKFLLLKVAAHRTYHIFLKPRKRDYPKFGLEWYHCDYGMVYGQFDKEYLIKVNGFKENEIGITGYPFVLPTDNIENIDSKERILYISGGLLVSNVIPSTIEEEKGFYRDLARLVNASGYKLIIKLHPRESPDLFEEYLKGYEHVSIVRNANLSNLVLNSEIIIGDYSTALFYGIKYYKPIIILKLKYFEKYPFEFIDFGIGIKSEINELSGILSKSESKKVNFDNYSKFISNYISDFEHPSSKRFYQNLKNIKMNNRIIES